MKIFVKLIYSTYYYSTAISNRFFSLFKRHLFRQCGKNVYIGKQCVFTYRNIEIGDDVFIGHHAMFESGKSIIRIHSKVLFGPHVIIRGGDHRYDLVGKYMFDVKEKKPENDADVTICDDVWVGAGAIILKGVTIGRGSVIGAGSIVTRSLPPYSISVGNPARVIKMRFSDEDIILHESSIYAHIKQ